MKKILYLMIVMLATLFAACLKNIDEVAANGETLVTGQLVDATNGGGAARVNVVVTDGRHSGATVQSGNDGHFEITVTAEQLGEGYYLLFTADSIYQSATASLSGILFGSSEYELAPVVLQGAKLPTISTDAVSGIEMTAAICGGTISDDGRSAIRRRGICWSTATNPTIVNTHSDAGSGTGHFTAALSGLQSGQTYYVRAYAVNGVGIAYGNEVSFTTQTGVPRVTTSPVTEVTQTSVTCGGVVQSDNGTAVTARGICYSSTSTQPTLNDAHTTDGDGTGSFVSTIGGLQSGRTYYLRAYATNSVGTGYGEVKTVTTF